MATGFAKPENALKRAEELVAVGQQHAALQALHDVITSKRHRTWAKVPSARHWGAALQLDASWRPHLFLGFRTQRSHVQKTLRTASVWHGGCAPAAFARQQPPACRCKPLKQSRSHWSRLDVWGVPDMGEIILRLLRRLDEIDGKMDCSGRSLHIVGTILRARAVGP